MDWREIRSEPRCNLSRAARRDVAGSGLPLAELRVLYAELRVCRAARMELACVPSCACRDVCAELWVPSSVCQAARCRAARCRDVCGSRSLPSFVCASCVRQLCAPSCVRPAVCAQLCAVASCVCLAVRAEICVPNYV